MPVVKMGEKGWKAFVPVYNLYILLKRCSKADSFWQFIVSGVLCGGLDVLYYANLLPQNNWQLWVCGIAQLVCVVWLLVLEIKAMHGVAGSFGHGAGFTVRLIFLTFIFQLTLSFGSSEYRPVNTPKSK